MSITDDPHAALLRMEGISKDFSGIPVLHGVDFELRRGEVMALVGENGAGKSTLMKILAGVHPEYGGNIYLEGRVTRFRNTREAGQAGIAMIYQELNLIPELSVAENIFLGREPHGWGGRVDFAAMNRAAERILADLHFKAPVQTPVAKLRVGHQQLVEIAKALSLDARIVIMDEPTSALSEPEAAVLFAVIRHLQERGVAVVYISHRMAELFAIADRITILRDGRTVGTVGAQEIDRQGLIQMMVGERAERFFVKAGMPAAEILLSVSHMTRRNPDPARPALVEDISFTVRRGEVFGIAGLLGAGRTELLEALFGVDAGHTTGRMEIGGKEVHLRNPESAIAAGIALITEDRKSSGLVPRMSVLHNLTLAALSRIALCGNLLSSGKEAALGEKMRADLAIPIHSLDLAVELLSGGNQQKVLLAKWLATRPCVLLLDDPTRGIDIGAKYEIYLQLADLARQGMAMVLTSSELPELISLCDRILVLREGRCSALLDREECTPERILDAAAPAA
ncbi:MAG TPA: sugar ABC transporter ATP-binding protein [bacterium]|nr:sugar ABC transporter ATP-binding protein [bacterium]HPR88003.1 sugar ABC transporter ATP-binding protein [bacterium]